MNSYKSTPELPQPRFDGAENRPEPQAQEAKPLFASETGLPDPEMGHRQTTAPVGQQGTAHPQANPVQIIADQTYSSVPQDQALPIAPSPLIAEDNDLIEKEWVDKAKRIVDSTRDDPYQQNREINKVKADYMKKRYNKDIKLTEE